MVSSPPFPVPIDFAFAGSVGKMLQADYACSRLATALLALSVRLAPLHQLVGLKTGISKHALPGTGPEAAVEGSYYVYTEAGLRIFSIIAFSGSSTQYCLRFWR